MFQSEMKNTQGASSARQVERSKSTHLLFHRAEDRASSDRASVAILARGWYFSYCTPPHAAHPYIHPPACQVLRVCAYMRA